MHQGAIPPLTMLVADNPQVEFIRKALEGAPVTMGRLSGPGGDQLRVSRDAPDWFRRYRDESSPPARWVSNSRHTTTTVT